MPPRKDTKRSSVVNDELVGEGISQRSPVSEQPRKSGDDKTGKVKAAKEVPAAEAGNEKGGILGHQPHEQQFLMAILEPLDPVDVEIPFTEDVELKYIASREGLMRRARQLRTARDKGLETAKKNELNTQNQQRTLETLQAAVRRGKTMQTARIGMIIAQFDALPREMRETALHNARKKIKDMPDVQRERMTQRMLVAEEQEVAALRGLRAHADTDAFVAARLHPQRMPNLNPALERSAVPSAPPAPSPPASRKEVARAAAQARARESLEKHNAKERRPAKSRGMLQPTALPSMLAGRGDVLRAEQEQRRAG